MKRAFRKYHRAIALILSLPILLTVLTGVIATFIREWGLNLGVSASWLIKIHTGEIFHLETIYPILNGVGLIGLIVTGIYMSGVLNRKSQPKLQKP